MKYFAISVLTLIVSGCAAMGLAPPAKWSHPYNTEMQFNQDKRECQYDAQKTVRPTGQALVDQSERVNIFTACMESRGYEPHN